MGRWTVEVFEYTDHIEVFQPKLHTFQMDNLDLVQGNYHEGRFGQLYETICSRLTQYIGAVGHPTKSKLPEGNVYTKSFWSSGLYLVREVFKHFVELGSPPTLFLFLFEFFFISIPVFPLSVASFIKCHVCCFTVELDVFRLFFPDHDRILEVDVYDDDQFVRARLKKKVLDVAEKYVDLAASMVRVAQTVLMNLYFSCNAFTIKSRSNEDVVKVHRLSTYIKLAMETSIWVWTLTSNYVELILLNYVL